MIVEQVRVELVYRLRRAVLRPGRPAEESSYPQDSEAVHFAAYDDGVIVGVATVFPEPYPDTSEAGWRLRGMAVAPDMQGRGVGAALLGAAVAQVRAEGGRLLWCNARVTVTGFYARAGLVVAGSEFEVPGGGPHIRMRAALA